VFFDSGSGLSEETIYASHNKVRNVGYINFLSDALSQWQKKISKARNMEEQ